MVSTKIFVLFGLVLCLLLVEAKPAPVNEDGLAQTNAINEPTLAPHHVVSHNTGAPHVTVAPEVLKVAPAADAATGVLSLSTTIAPAAITSEPAKELSPPASTSGPAHVVAGGSTMKPIVVVHTTVLPTIAAAATHINGSKSEACTGICDYLKPICESLDKISAKQMFKIQTQFKQFVQKTNGKMSLCLVDHYQLDPTFKPVSHDDLSAICASKKIVGNGKGSFEAFQTCAANHWDPELDKELAAIKAARADSTNHQHPESKAVAANIEHDEEELSMISDVVNKVLGHGGNLNEKNSDVKVIDVSGGNVAGKATPTNATIASVASHNKTATTVSPKDLLKDPNNTVMVFVDDKTTTVAPAHFDTSVHITNSTTVKPAAAATAVVVANSTIVHVSTIKPAAANSTTSTHVKIEKGTPHSTNVTTVSPSLSTKAPVAINATTIAPVKANGTTTVTPTTLKPSGASSNVTTTIVPISLSTKSPVASTTLAPTKAATTTTTPTTTTALPITTAPTTTKAPATTVKPTLKPIDTLEQILHRQEKERQELDNKLKAERTKAIAQLKKQDVSPHTAAADAKIHQREHERQMTIDPIGHTIKHQQYEANKQRKLGSDGSKQ